MTTPMTTFTTPFARRGSRVRTVAARSEIQAGESTETIALVSSVFTMVTILSVWFLLQVLVLSGYAQQRDQHLLYGEFRTQVAEATAPLGPVIEPGAPVAVLTIPSIGLEQVVTEGTAAGDLRSGPGHLRNTVIPGQVGISQVFGRASTYGAPFGKLHDLELGDEVIAQTGQARTIFKVEAIRHGGDEVAAPAAGTSRLTLVTAQGHGFLSSLRPSEVLYVDAIAAQGQPVPAGRPTAVPTSELAMHQDLGATPMLALGLALLTGLTFLVIAARQRWSAALVWVIAAPVAVALAWFTTDQVVRLLPNLM